jgi:hypothetical protein
LIVTILAAAMVFSMVGAASAGIFDFLEPHASLDDKVFEDIGGDEFLNATLTGCIKTGEESIPDAAFNTSLGEWNYYSAKNITYKDVDDNEGYMVVWKTTPDKYPVFDTSDKVNQYVTLFLSDINAKAFIEYSYENNQVYGIILGCDNIDYSEADMVYDVLGLDPSGFVLSDAASTTSSSSYSGSTGGGHDHYHTVVEDRYSLSRNDPGAYYDHYEYGDNYDIDDYLESEGYD